MHVELHEGEEIILELKPDKRAVFYFMLSRTWHFIVFVLFMGFFIGFQSIQQSKALLQSAEQNLAHNSNLMLYLGIGAVAFVLVLLIFRLYVKAMLNGYDYIITNQRCILSYGFLSLNKRYIPMQQINDVDMRASFFERLFGFSSVYIDTISTMLSANQRRGSANNTCRLEGLSMDDADRVMHAISEHITKGHR